MKMNSNMAKKTLNIRYSLISKLKSRMFLVLVILIGVFPETSEAECQKGNCNDGQGIWLENNYSYAGSFKNGKKHGQGVDKIGSTESYRIYNGNFKNGSYDGSGVLYIYNRRDNPYIFGKFEDGNLANNSEVLMKFENDLSLYYRVNNNKDGSTNLILMEEKSADLFCSKNPTYISCLNRFMHKNQEAVMALMAIGYIGFVVNSDTKLSFSDLSNGVKLLADTMQKRRDERADDFANRIAKKLGIR